LLRRYSIALPGRQVTRAADFRGAPLRHGDSVMLFLPGANIDAAFYADPTQIVLNRPESHIAFGMGPHRCVGQHLARIELNILYEEWLARIPPFRLNSDKPWQFHPALVLSIDALPLVWR
jgi:cytochrome P450